MKGVAAPKTLTSATLTDPTITGTATVTGATGLAAQLGTSGIPFIGLSSGSVGADGAITGITALPIAYPSAYCYFPANILATSITAGWHYCTFSTTQVGVAYLNTYTPATDGVPTIPASPTAVTDGKGAFTGDTGEEFGPTITVPANSAGVNGFLRGVLYWAQTNNANAKNVRVRYSGNAGTIFAAPGIVSTISQRAQVEIHNRGATNVQVSFPSSASIGMWQIATANPTVGAVDTTAATTLVLSLQRATATDNLVLEYFSWESIYR